MAEVVKIVGEKLRERLEDDVTENREGHEFRYRLASGFTTRGDVVFDMACGTGYGERFFRNVVYRGVDRDPPWRMRFMEEDLSTWKADGVYYDVAVSFETIEHLPDYTQFLKTLTRARKWVVASVPIVPTVGNNPWHFHDFAPGELAQRLLEGTSDWGLYETVQQPSEDSEIVVLRRAK